MKIEKISDGKLDYVSVVCLDPSISSRKREVMRSVMTDRTCWIRKMMQNGLEILVALEKPKRESARLVLTSTSVEPALKNKTTLSGPRSA